MQMGMRKSLTSLKDLPITGEGFFMQLISDLNIINK